MEVIVTILSKLVKISFISPIYGTYNQPTYLYRGELIHGHPSPGWLIGILDPS